MGLLGVPLKLGQREPAEEGVLDVIRRGLRRPGARTGSDRERHEVGPLADRVHPRPVGGVGVQNGDERPLAVRGVEAGDAREGEPAADRVPAESVRQPLGPSRRLLPGSVREGGDLREEPLEHIQGLGILGPPGRSQLPVDGMRHEDRTVSVREPHALDQLGHLGLVDALGVQEQPHGQRRVRVDIIDHDLRLLVDDEPQTDSRRDLLTGRERHQPDASGVVVEGEPPGGGVHGGTLAGPVQRDAVGRKGAEIQDLSEREVDTHVCLLYGKASVPTDPSSMPRISTLKTFDIIVVGLVECHSK